jgi:hypothetical protein
VLPRPRWRQSDWLRYGLLALLAVVALLCRAGLIGTSPDDQPATSPTGAFSATDPNDPNAPDARLPLSQFPAVNDNCTDTLSNPAAGNNMRILTASGTGPDVCAGGEKWFPTEQSVVTGQGMAVPGG